jgi:hypothetical protein
MSLIGRVVSQIGTAAIAHGRPRDARARTSGQPPIAGIPNPEFGSMSNMRTRSPWGFRKPLTRMVRDGMAIHRRPRSLDRKGAATSGRVSWPLHRDAAGHARGGRAARRSECSPGSRRHSRRLAETSGLRAAWTACEGRQDFLSTTRSPEGRLRRHPRGDPLDETRRPLHGPEESRLGAPRRPQACRPASLRAPTAKEPFGAPLSDLGLPEPPQPFGLGIIGVAVAVASE